MILSIIFLLSPLFSSKMNCPIYKCDNTLPEGQCVKKTDSFITVHPCDNKQNECNILSDELDDSFCTPKQTINYKLFPGFTCNKNSQCYSGICEIQEQRKICIGKSKGEECISTDECNKGLTCKEVNGKKQCTDVQLNCITDDHCSFNKGCLNGRCREYFSLPDGTEVGDDSSKAYLSFCSGGFAIDGKCVTLKSKVAKRTCNDDRDCEYIDSKGVLYNNIKDSCQCGYGLNQKSYCKLQGGDYNYTRFINYLTDYYKTGNCSLSEHGTLFGCVADKREKKAQIKEKMNKLYNFFLWANFNYRMYDAADCVISVEYPDYDILADEPEPFQVECAKYKCIPFTNGEQPLCAQSFYNNHSDIEIQLFYNKTIIPKQICSIENSPNEFFYNNATNKIASYVDKTIDLTIRYSGEDCVQDSQCENVKYDPESIIQFCNSTTKKCGGYQKGDYCEDHDMCLAGLFCDKDHKCKEQKDEESYCENSYQCKNNLLCYQKKCKDALYLFDVNYTFSSGELSDSDEKFYQKFCKYDLIDRNTLTCISYASKNQTDENEDFVKCNVSQKCTYEVKPLNQLINKNCECGYNEEGNAYCPLDHEKHTDLWDKYYALLKQVADNSCHTLNRYNCYKEHEKEKELINMYKNMLLNGHLFYKSAFCAESILSGVYLNSRCFLVIGIIINVFLYL